MAKENAKRSGAGARAKQPNARARVDWHAAETRYVTGNESLRELAAELGCSETQTFEHSRTKGWEQKRREHRTQVAEAAREAAKQRAIMDEAQLNSHAHRFGVAAMKRLRRQLKGTADTKETQFAVAAYRQAFETARLASSLTAMPEPAKATGAGLDIIIRGRDEFGVIEEEHAGDSGDKPTGTEATDADGRSERLPADANAGEVSPQS